MARDFDGVDDSLVNSPADGLARIDAGQITYALRANIASRPVTPGAILEVQTTHNASTNWRQSLAVGAQVSSGWTLRFFQRTNGTAGQWRTDDLNFSQWYHLGATYDRGALTNDPLLYVDGSSVAVAEVATPTMTVLTGQDNCMIGAAGTGGTANEVDGVLAHLAAWNVILSASEVAALARGVSPFRIRPANLVLYAPIFGGAAEADLAQNDTYTVRGTTAAAGPPSQQAPLAGFDGWPGGFTTPPPSVGQPYAKRMGGIAGGVSGERPNIMREGQRRGPLWLSRHRPEMGA